MGRETAQASSYDEVPYESYPYAQTHPDRLATIAQLFQMQPAAIDRCRVLELGCAAGGNLIPMAVQLPGSRFVGIDLSARQIADGRRVVADLKISNIQLEHRSILDLDERLGAFDYILCHGVYSWVPDAVQEKVLKVCTTLLQPQGVAYVSYNTYPGWHMSGMIRDMLRYHARRFTRPQDAVGQSRALLNFLAETAAEENSAYSILLKEGLEFFRKVSDSYLLHEYLEEVNEPLYFHEFVERLGRHRLQYLAEAEVHAMMPERLGSKIAATLEKLSSEFIEMEQFLDFVRNRKFRQTLICHAGVPLQRKVGASVLRPLFVASSLRPVSQQPDLRSEAEERFRRPDGRTASTTEPVLKAALIHLAEHWPQAVAFVELSSAAHAALGPDKHAGAPSEELLGKALLQLYASNLVELRTWRPPFTCRVADRPQASPLARLQAAAGTAVTNLRHERIALNVLERLVLRQLDGRHDRSALLDHLIELAARGTLEIKQEGHLLESPETHRAVLSAQLDACLAGLAKQALLWSDEDSTPLTATALTRC
jgi:methyltransferase-like protein/SAM-dependent methyltransferase